MSHKSFEKQYLQVYDKYADDIFRYIFYKIYNYEIARDLTQEVFTKAWKYLVDGNKVDNLRALLYKMATNLVIDHHRKKVNKEYSIEDLLDQGFSFADNENHMDIKNDIDFKIALNMIDKLEDKYKDIFYLRYVDGLKPKEIAQITGESPNTISVRISRAVKKMKEIYNNKKL